MRTKILFISLLIIVICGCGKDHDCQEKRKLGTIRFSATQSNAPFNGGLEIFPCNLNTSIYYGNYLDGKLSVITPSYVIKDGQISGTGVPLSLPLGDYTLVYWGVDNTPSYSGGVSTSGAFRIGTDLSTQNWGLRPNYGSGTYKPAYNLVMGIKNISIGSDNVNIPLKRVVAGVNVIIKTKDNTPFNNNIASFTVLIGGVASNINYISAAPDFTNLVTVEFPLTISVDRLQASNLTAMLYPSEVNPPITIVATLLNGITKSYSTNLSNPLIAGDIQTITVSIDQITGGSGSISGFTVSSWTETNQTIVAGPFN